ncbi:hypothetical protein [Streptomyces mirabilis]|uniref:hypothetical protein n=1 Tax=Streptomyces mirabilis TaxID=68239 RepID=UPI0036BB3BDB
MASSPPLARSGASTWTPKEREANAHDLDDPRALIAVSATSIRSKADKDPTQWLPPVRRLPVHLRHQLDRRQDPLPADRRPRRADRPG